LCPSGDNQRLPGRGKNELGGGRAISGADGEGYVLRTPPTPQGEGQGGDPKK
jgi:hypothetical protein